MSDYLIKGETLTSIADSIRAKTGGTESIMPSEFASEINSIETGGASAVETVTGTIDFYSPYIRYYFYYEDGNGVINTFNTVDSNLDGIPIDFTIRKNSIIVFHCYTFAIGNTNPAVGLSSDILEAANGNGIEIIQNTTLINGSNMIVDAICKVTGDFNISWYVEDEPDGPM